MWRGTGSKTTKRGAEQGAGVPFAAVAVKGLARAMKRDDENAPLTAILATGVFQL